MHHTVALRIKQARKELKLTQADLAAMVGVTTNQITKYERCVDRVSCGRLSAIANALGREVSWFFK
jgi:transcriptional regulator with XRE-family HTH domain